jgi:hypothetical protein
MCATIAIPKTKIKLNNEKNNKVLLMRAMVRRCQILPNWLLLVVLKMQEKELGFLLLIVVEGMRNLQKGFLMFLFYV